MKTENRQLDITMLRSLVTLTRMISLKLWVKGQIQIAGARVGREEQEGWRKSDVVVRWVLVLGPEKRITMKEITHTQIGWRDSSVMENVGVYRKDAHTLWSSNRREGGKSCHRCSGRAEWVWSARLTADSQKTLEVWKEVRKGDMWFSRLGKYRMITMAALRKIWSFYKSTVRRVGMCVSATASL